MKHTTKFVYIQAQDGRHRLYDTATGEQVTGRLAHQTWYNQRDAEQAARRAGYRIAQSRWMDDPKRD